jgi:hypothetical protein
MDENKGATTYKIRHEQITPGQQKVLSGYSRTGKLLQVPHAALHQQVVRHLHLLM